MQNPYPLFDQNDLHSCKQLLISILNMKEDYLYAKYQWAVMKELRKRPLNGELKHARNN